MSYVYPHSPVDSKLLWNSAGLPNPDCVREAFVNEYRLSPTDAMKILDKSQRAFRNEPNVLAIRGPLIVCGDIHGQFYDLLHLLDMAGSPKTTKYLFLGDYVDRGCFSTEVVFYLCTLKLNYPDNIYILRGNHECEQMTQTFLFSDEVQYKYPNTALYHDFLDLFQTLPLAAVIDDRFFAVHGGISPSIEKVSDINRINRFSEIPEQGLFCDLLWADPVDDVSKDQLFVRNTSRGVSHFFTYTAACRFLEKNSLLSIIRGHEAQSTGYKLHKVHKKTQFPTVITVFSSPNYVDSYGNKGAYLSVNKSTVNFRQFSHSPHPYFLPGFLDCFSWSLPFVAENLTALLAAILTKELDSSLDLPSQVQDMSILANSNSSESSCNEEVASNEQFSEEKKRILRTKIMALSKVSKMYTNLRKRKESSIVLGNLAGSKVVDSEILSDSSRVKQAIGSFDSISSLDKRSEMHPKPKSI
ncbi:hypothetical protein GEMRC1_007548 [Eukaryota sp. GEM-RC1]